MSTIGKIFLLLSLIFFILGLIIYFGGDLLKKIWNLIPLNFQIEGKNWKIFFPLGASITISIIITIILNIIRSLNK